jgi:hypothetical protein
MPNHRVRMPPQPGDVTARNSGVTLLPDGPCLDCDWQGALLGLYAEAPFNVSYAPCNERKCVDEKNPKPCPRPATGQLQALLQRLRYVALVLRPQRCPGFPHPLSDQAPNPGGNQGSAFALAGLTCCHEENGHCQGEFRCFDCGTDPTNWYSTQVGCVQECLRNHEMVHVRQCRGDALINGVFLNECEAYRVECECLADKVEKLLPGQKNFILPCCGQYEVGTNAQTCLANIDDELRKFQQGTSTSGTIFVINPFLM